MPRASVRDQIVESALVEFHRLGFNACSVEDITRHASVPKGSFYNHFKSKEELALLVIDLYADSAAMELLATSTLPPLKRLRAHFAVMAKPFHEEGFQRGCLLANFVSDLADHSPEIQAKLNSTFGKWSDGLARVIREGQKSGEISGEHTADTWASFLLSNYEGALLRARAAKQPQALKIFESVTLPMLAA